MLDLGAWREWRSWIPAECPGCERRVPGQGLCAQCAAKLQATNQQPCCPVCAHPLIPGCPDCLRRPPAFDGVVAAFDYAGLGKQLVTDYKLAGRLSLARLLADHLVDAVQGAPVMDDSPVDWVVPVPARSDSLRQRGFSPPAEVARIAARRLHLPYRLDLVRRVREGSKQSVLGRAARLRAPEGAYACSDDGTLAGRHVVVVDDVLTTGSTLHAVAVALKAAGAARVQGWVLARAGADPHRVLQ